MGQFTKFFGKNSPFLPKRGLTPHPLCVTIKLYVNLSVSLTLASHSPFRGSLSYQGSPWQTGPL